MLSYDTICGNRVRKLKQNHVRLLTMTGSAILHEYSAFNIFTVFVLFTFLILIHQYMDASGLSLESILSEPDRLLHISHLVLFSFLLIFSRKSFHKC